MTDKREPDPAETPSAAADPSDDFTGGDLSYFAADAEAVQVVPTTTNGRILRSFASRPIRPSST